MSTNARAAWALGLGLAGLVALVGRTSGQDGGATKGAARPLAPSVVGCIDLGAILKGYNKVEFLNKQLEDDYKRKQQELMQIYSEGEKVAKEMERLNPGTPDYKEGENKLNKLKIDFEAAREQAQREFAQKQADQLAVVFNEIQASVAYVAKYNSISYVVQVDREPVNSADPRTVTMALARPVLYYDSATDLTKVVMDHLNGAYQKASGGRAPATATPPAATPTPGAGANAPRNNPAPAPGGAARPNAGGR